MHQNGSLHEYTKLDDSKRVRRMLKFEVKRSKPN